MSEGTPAPEPRAEERIIRTVTAITAVGALFLLVVSISPIIDVTPYLYPLYAVGAPVLVFAGMGVLLLVTFRLRLPGIRRAHAVYATLFVVIVLAWLPSMSGRSLPEGVNPWVLEIVVLGAVPAAIAWPSYVAWSYLVFNSIIVAPIRYLSAGQVDWVEPLQYSLLTLTLGGIFTALALIAVRNARAVDAATALLETAAARSAAAAARSQEQTRLDALVHDEVMSTLYYAAQGEDRLGESVRNQARHALAQLERLRSGRDDSATPVEPELLTARLRALVLVASVAIGFASTGERSRPIPAHVAAAFAEATSEAARNSLIHAGAATRSVTVRYEENLVRVQVSDDGVGFEQRGVTSHRLGIQVSIRGRMSTVDGGSAVVESERGTGTVVTLLWTDA